MLAAEITIGAMDTRETARNLMPSLLKRLQAFPQDSFLTKIILKMGTSASDVLLDILGRMPQARQQELLCTITDFFGPQIEEKLNTALAESIGEVQMRQISLRQEDNGELVLAVGQVSCDYPALIRSQKPSQGGILEWAKSAAIGGAATVVEHMDPDDLERLGIAVLETPPVKRKVLEAVGKVATDKGLSITLKDIRFEQVSGPSASFTDSGTRVLHFSKGLEESIKTAGTAYFKERFFSAWGRGAEIARNLRRREMGKASQKKDKVRGFLPANAGKPG